MDFLHVKIVTMIKPVLLKKVFILVLPSRGESPILRQCGHFDTSGASSKNPKDSEWFYTDCETCDPRREEK